MRNDAFFTEWQSLLKNIGIQENTIANESWDIVVFYSYYRVVNELLGNNNEAIFNNNEKLPWL